MPVGGRRDLPAVVVSVVRQAPGNQYLYLCADDSSVE